MNAAPATPPVAGPPARPFVLVPKRRRRLRKFAVSLCVLAALAGGIFVAYRLTQAGKAAALPTAPARQGEFLVVARCRGELRARVSRQIIAPVNVPELRIVWLAPAGEPVKQGDPVIRFDPSSVRQQLQEKQAALQQAQATLDQAVAEALIISGQDKVEYADAQYQVERARMEVSKQEIVSRLQGEESKIDLGIAEKKLSVQRATLELHEASNKAKIASLARLRDQAKTELEITRYRLSQMEIAAPLSGVVFYLPNFSQGWVNAKPFKVGDQAWPGGAIAEIPDLSTLEMEGKLEEIDRGRISAGSDVIVRLDALPEASIPAELANISPLTQQNWEWPPSRNFRGYARILKPDTRLRPGMNGTMDVIVERIPRAISVPAKALFTYQGKPVVYVAAANGYERRNVEIVARNIDEVAVKGLPAGARVALVEVKEEARAR
ncbi:MAG: HlyD family efflux transporter periplasmic adaptor subunit [Acidobacteria bacterium]|nr:HlyD family efflux transporter periplasmic adaptor subunit [Acidobacteriota bacterium]